VCVCVCVRVRGVRQFILYHRDACRFHPIHLRVLRDITHCNHVNHNGHHEQQSLWPSCWSCPTRVCFGSVTLFSTHSQKAAKRVSVDNRQQTPARTSPTTAAQQQHWHQQICSYYCSCCSRCSCCSCCT